MKRDKSIDIARGISMILVLAGHCKYVDINFKIWLYSFHMPLFFFLSGMVFSYKKYPNFMNFFKNKIKNLIIPYLSLGIVVIILNIFYNSFITKTISISSFFSGFLNNLKQLLLGYRLHNEYYSFWFITTLFVALILFFLLLNIIDNKKGKTIILFSISLVSSVFQLFLFKNVNGFYWSIDLVPISLTFISLGYIFKEKKDFVSNHLFKFDFFIVLLIISIILSFINYKYFSIPDLFYCKMGNYFIFMIAAILGIFITLIISKIIGTSKILEYIGKNTFIYYMFHSIIVFPICDYIIWKFLNITNVSLSKNVLFWIYIVISCVILLGISFIINRFFPFLFGKSNGGKNEKK